MSFASSHSAKTDDTDDAMLDLLWRTFCLEEEKSVDGQAENESEVDDEMVCRAYSPSRCPAEAAEAQTTNLVF